MKEQKAIYLYIILAAFLLAHGCAQQGSPSGGPRDESPPVVLKAIPENYSINFDARKISITFDEYLEMSNFTQELVVSPPMLEKPLVRLKNKTLIIEFEEEMKEEVTYTFNFGEGIKDLNEKNVLLNYEYVFSTGDYLDSLSVKGTLRNAFDLSIPKPPINVMLYNELADSLPLTEIPYYVGRSDAEGNFAVNNLKPGIYKLFVLIDGNNNFLFDLPSEEIAFLDTSLLVDGDFFRETLLESGVYDSTDLFLEDFFAAYDTTGMSADSITILMDSIESAKPDFNSIYLDLFMFTEDPVNQFITEYERKDRHFLKMLFNIPLTDSFAFSPVYPPSLSVNDLIPEFGQNRDSLVLWLADTLIAGYDTIGIALNYTVLDTLSKPLMVTDTLQFMYRETTSATRRTTKTETKKILNVATISNRGKHQITKEIIFTLDQPLGQINPELFELFIFQDTIEIPLSVSPFADSMHLRRARISNKWEEESKYRLVVYPGAIENIYGLTNDTLDITFQIRPLEEYGRINLNLQNVNQRLIIQILKKDKLIGSREISTSGTYTFDFMNPDTYIIKIVHDENGNGKWDTGNYLKAVQPEKVEFVPKELKVRANWDHDVTYVIGSNIKPPASADEEDNSVPLF